MEVLLRAMRRVQGVDNRIIMQGQTGCRPFTEPILKSVHLPEVLKFGAFRCRNLYNLVISIEHFDEKVLF